MATKKNGFNTGIASEYLVLSMLYRLNYEAYITMGNKKSVDIWIKRYLISGSRLSGGWMQ